MFKSIKISASSIPYEWDREGYLTELEAWQYVIDKFMCAECKKEVKKGKHPSLTACGAEWVVEEYE
jgi:hypothetical protein